jgi:hypothetical protein
MASASENLDHQSTSLPRKANEKQLAMWLHTLLCWVEHHLTGGCSVGLMSRHRGVSSDPSLAKCYFQIHKMLAVAF